MTDRARLVGRTLRLALGGLILLSLTPFLAGLPAGEIALALALAVALALFYLALHLVLLRSRMRLNPWAGAALALVPVIVVYLFGGRRGDEAALLFLGISLVLAAIRSDAGCEVMSVPSALTGRRTHLCCLLFAPVDWLERRLTA
jgi:hypothetical protein